MKTIAPNVAVRLRKLSTSALIGTSTLPNSMNSTTNVVTATRPIAHGKRSNTTSLESTWAADCPPTSTSSNGESRSRTSSTSASPSADSGSTPGTTENHVPPSLAKRTDIAPGGATSAPPMYEPVKASTRATPSSAESSAA